MTKDEILDELERLFIITKLNDQYFISKDIIRGRVKATSASEFMTKKKEIQKVTEYSKILDPPKVETSWPLTIYENRGRKRAQFFLHLGKVPNLSKGGYRLRGLNDKCIRAIDTLVDKNPRMLADILFKEIEYYYKHTVYPKTFKNFVLEGDMLDVYNEAVERYNSNTTRPDPGDLNSNSTWG